MRSFWAPLLCLLLIFKTISAAELTAESPQVIINVVKEQQQQVEETLDFGTQKSLVLNELLAKFNALVSKKNRVDSIPWNAVKCTGWPAEVKSRIFRNWTPEDVKILRQKMSEIKIELCSQDYLNDVMNVVIAMLRGEYSNEAFESLRCRYALLSFLGKGGHGFVLKARSLADSHEVAIKFVNHLHLNSNYFVKHPRFQSVPIEVDILSKIKHPGVIGCSSYMRDKVYSCFVLDIFGTEWRPLLQELPRCIGFERDRKVSHNLGSCILAHQFMRNEIVQFIFAQIYDAVLHLHAHNICHGDLKCENVLVDADYRIKLIDFGVAKYIPRNEDGQEGLLSNFGGTKIYMAPEMIRKEPYLASEVETWALGVILYRLQRRQDPFIGCEEVLSKDLEFPACDSTGIHDLTQKMLSKDRCDRIKLSAVADHYWMKSFKENSSAGKKKSLNEDAKDSKKRKTSD